MILPKIFLPVFCLFLLPSSFGSDEDDYYKLLGVERNADLREIRRAFKKLAITKHPDKNKDDPNAHANFVKLAAAYDVLKDPTKRNQYDMYGKKAFENQSSPKYHSYTYYRDQFGIYDDDPLVTTLGRDDFKNSVGDGIWFVNFYSPLCSHCHHLAPDWRELSKNLEGVVKIGAVNCEDDRNLCWELQIQQFPTLLFYDEQASMHDGREYFGNRITKAMENYIMSHMATVTNIPKISTKMNPAKAPWIVFLDSTTVEDDTNEKYKRIKLAAVLKGLVSVGYTEDDVLIKELIGENDHSVVIWRPNEPEKVMPIFGDTYNMLADDILTYLPEARKINQEDFQGIRSDLREGASVPWLLCFSLDADTLKTVMLKKLAGILDGFNIGEVNCARSSGLCNSLHVTRYPTWGILKKGGAFEVHTGPSSLHSIERFARDAQEATNIHALSPQDLQNIMSEGSPWIIGWLLTGCPPCKRMLPALRKASIHFTPDIIQFGTVDCAQHSHICSRYNIHSYPTTAIYNASTVITFSGDSSVNSIIDFIQTMKSNYVITLNRNNFNKELENKPESIMYVVEFYAPWCAPCQRLQPEWMKVAQKLSDLNNIKMGAVNCELEKELCMMESIRSYPTIRLYPLGSVGKSTIAMYSSPHRDFANIRQWILSFLPTPMISLNGANFRTNILSTREDRTWVVMFFAPWCGFCHQVEPEFFIAVERLKNIVIAAKVDCQREGALCQQENIGSYPTIKLYQRVDGVTKISSGITIEAYNQESLYAEIKAYAAKAYITPVEHDEL